MPDLSAGQGDTCYLTDVSSKDKPWDVHRAQADRVRDLYRGTLKDALATRMEACSGLLSFGQVADGETGEVRLKLRAARFCRCRLCPVCQWRRSLMWVARLLKALPDIQRDHPTARYLFLTLTVKNCELSELRQTLDWMSKSWKRLIERKKWPAVGFIRSTEVTRSKDGFCHPHFHALLMVNPGYFAGKNYLNQQQWTELWRSCLRVDYNPIVDVRVVKPNKQWLEENGHVVGDELALSGSIVETLKYAVKPKDLMGEGTEADREWLLELTNQLHKTRAVAVGGTFVSHLSESEPEDLIGEGDKDVDKIMSWLFFGWRERASRYVKVSVD